MSLLQAMLSQKPPTLTGTIYRYSGFDWVPAVQIVKPGQAERVGRVPKSETFDRIIDAVKYGNDTIMAVAKDLGLSKSMIGDYVKELEAAGRLLRRKPEVQPNGKGKLTYTLHLP